MKKILIIIICLFLLLTSGNLGTSKPTINSDSKSEIDYLFDNSFNDKAQEQQILKNINKLDGFFTENQGQVGNDSVRYYIQGKGVWFLDDGVVFEIQEPPEQTEVQQDPSDRFNPDFKPEAPKPIKRVVLRLNFEGCNKIDPKGVGLLPHRSNYFYGNDSSKWCTNVPNFQEIVYENIYDDIDLRYYSNDNGLKYDFIVRPGGDPTDIILNYQDAKDLKIEGMDNLIIETSLGNIVDSNLFIYQEPINVKNKIDGGFKLIDSETYGFKIFDDYDKNEILIIDPILYASYAGGNNDDRGYCIAVDSNGNAYATGYTLSSNLPTTPNANDTTFNIGYDSFVLKLNQTGDSLIYSTFIGGNDYEYGWAITVDSVGNAYATGATGSANFPTTSSANDTTINGGYDLYILKLDPTGASLIYSTFIGGSNDDNGYDIAIDTSGNAYVTGGTLSTNFPTTLGSNDTTFNGVWDVFVLKLNPTGALLIYSTFIGGDDYDCGLGIFIDSGGNAYVTGGTNSINFPTTLNANDTTPNGDRDVFVIKLNPSGVSLQYSTFIGGNSIDFGHGIAIDQSGNMYITGVTWSTNFPTTLGANDTTFNGICDAFVLKLNPTGASLIYSTYIGGDDNDVGYDIAIDPNGNSYISGGTQSSNFPTTSNANDTTYNGWYDIFVVKLNLTGDSLIYSTFIGGNNNDEGQSIAIDFKGDGYVTGQTSSSNFPTTSEANDTTYNGALDCFMLKINFTKQYPPIVENLNISKPSIKRTNSVSLFTNGTDIEDVENDLTPHFEYRNPNHIEWDNKYFSAPKYQNSRWEIGFTPLKNAMIGYYDFRVRFNDTFKLFSNWFYLNDSLLVLNNIPLIEDIALSNNSAMLSDSIPIWINATDIEEIEENLTIELEYRDSSETSWDKIYLSGPTFNNGRWEFSLNIPFDALFGYYDFRARCNDSDGNYSTWLYLNDSLLVYNTGPRVIDVDLSESSIYRTESVSLYINGSDYETPESMLSFYIQYKPQSESKWTNLTSNYFNNRYEVSLITYTDSKLGNYDFRVKFLDNESVSSGWKYINDSLEALNNLPIISDTLDDITVGIQPLILDLAQYESDIEDTGLNLTWSIDPQIYTYIESIGIIDIVNDTLKITPKENVSGTEDIELTLTDKDSGTAVKSDITIIIDSTISEFTPKVTLLSPVDKAVINTLTPTLKWSLDYSGTEIITYSVVLDENPDPQTTIIAGLTSTEYTLENELIDGKTYYWKVEPINGICLSGVYRFTINLGFEPIYRVNLTAETESATIKQGATKDINLTVTNEGNSIENFQIEISSVNLQSQISVDKNNVQLDPGIDTKVKLNIDIPDDFTIGDYTITVTATSLTDSIVKDEVTIDVKVVSKDFVPDYDVSISISPSSLNLNQGDSENFTITITNNGNIQDDFTISFESDDFASANIQFSDISVPITDGDSDTITVTIKIPEDMAPGLYTIKFIVESSDDPKESTLTITVKDKDDEKPGDKKGDEDNTMLYALIGIIVIIIVVLILLFIFLKKKKGKEEEPPVEEVQAPPPEEVPPEVTPEQVPTPEVPTPEQPPTPEVPPEQVPVPEKLPTEQTQVPEVPPEQPPTPEVTPQVPQPQVEPTPAPTPMPQVEEPSQPTPQIEPQPQVEVQEPAVEQPVEPQGQAPVPRVKEPRIKAPEEYVE